MSLKFFASAAAFLCATSVAQAAELGDMWTSVRALGMGNAYTAFVSNGDALFYNPGGLGRNSAFRWTVLDPRVGANGTEGLTAAQGLIGSSDLASSLEKMYGKKVWLGGGARSEILIPNFAIAGFASTEGGLYLQNPADPQLNTNYFLDYGVAMGTGFEVIPQVFMLGVSAKRINRTGTTLPIGAATLATLNTDALTSELKSRGTGYAVDFGTVLTAPGPISPSLSFVYRNIGYTEFSHEEGAHAPPRIAPEMVVGTSLRIKLPLITITPAIDYRYADRSDIQLGNKLHAGIDIDLPLIDLRVGLNQGYYTAGLGLDFGIMRFDAATYGVELGEYPGQQEDRRYIAQVTFDLGFDPGRFGGSSPGGAGDEGNSGVHHRLKQRR